MIKVRLDHSAQISCHLPGAFQIQFFVSLAVCAGSGANLDCIFRLVLARMSDRQFCSSPFWGDWCLWALLGPVWAVRPSSGEFARGMCGCFWGDLLFPARNAVLGRGLGTQDQGAGWQDCRAGTLRPAAVADAGGGGSPESVRTGAGPGTLRRSRSTCAAR